MSGAIRSIGKLFGIKKPKVQPIKEDAPQETDADVQSAAAKERRRLRANQGLGATILTSESGTGGDPRLGTKTIMGG